MRPKSPVVGSCRTVCVALVDRVERVALTMDAQGHIVSVSAP
ncbi:hypothetical protein [Streptomyces microflavus]